MALTYIDAQKRLQAAGQEQLLQFWDRLERNQQEQLLAQIEAVDWRVVQYMQSLLPGAGAPGAASGHTSADIHPLSPALPSAPERAAACAAGEQALREGKVGVILVAGGQGSRLGYEGPKGVFAIGPVSGASLFCIHARKILALRRRYGAPVPFYIMTSAGNDAETRRFFETHRYFGLPAEEVYFFQQGMFPALGPDGRILMEAPDRLFMAPDGHGGVLAALNRAALLDNMLAGGVETLFYFQVDNPLVEVAHPEFIGFHRLHDASMSLKVCVKRHPEEPVGKPVWRGERMAIVEYSEFTREQKHARGADGELLFKYGSVAIHIFARDFLQKQANAGLPLHCAHKKVPCCDAEGRRVTPGKPNAYKFEKFIFDALPEADRPYVQVFLREEEFSPVKNATGEDSPDTARQDLMAKYARWLETIGIAIPRTADGALRYKVEIDPCFALNAEELRQRLPAGFVWDRDLFLQAEDG